MQDRLNLFVLVRKFNSLDGPAGILDELVITESFSFLPLNALRVVVFVDGPHGVGVEARGDVVVLARFGQLARGFGLTALFLAARGGLREFARYVDEFLDFTANVGEVFFDARAAIADNLAGSSLIPVDTPGLNDLV